MSDLGEDKWRARVPFMRLPRNFEELLPPVKEGLFGTDMRSPDEGGDGISPLFWFDWRKDEFTPKKYGTRCREIAIYSRTGEICSTGIHHLQIGKILSFTSLSFCILIDKHLPLLTMNIHFIFHERVRFCLELHQVLSVK